MAGSLRTAWATRNPIRKYLWLAETQISSSELVAEVRAGTHVSVSNMENLEPLTSAFL